MSTVGKPGNAPWMSPYITVSDVEKAAHFYQKAFCFEILELPPSENGIAEHGELRYQDQLIMIGKQGAWGSTTVTPSYSKVESPINLYLYCANVDEFHAAAVKAGAKSLAPPEDMFWGDRMCRLQDNDGYTWAFATFSGERK